MRSEEEIRNMYETLLKITEFEVESPKQHEGFRVALWWVLNED